MKEYSQYSDLELLEFLKSSDANAFTLLYQRYWKRLLAKANYLLRSNEDAEDIIHELFVSLWKRREDIRVEHHFSTYISAALKYLCLKKAAEKRAAIFSLGQHSLHVSSDDSTYEWIAFQQLQRQLSSALDDLPKRCRIIFQMSREWGLTDKQIAGQLQLSTATVRTQKHRALTRLKLSLGQLLGSFLLF